MGLQGRAFQANIFIVDMVFLGDTRSAEELAVFTNMAPERLCLGCGLRVEEKFTPIFPGERGPLCNTVLRTKQVIIGCGGGFHQECTQPYSPVARWMSEVDVALNDEGQQYGNLDEASAIARVPRKGLVVWCGDHKQTPGGTAQER